MGKRYKKGNVGRKRKIKPKQIYFRREKQINNLINEFKKEYYTNKDKLNTLETYVTLYNLKTEIKHLLYLQENMITVQSYTRRTVYYKKLGRFKRIYSRWKHETVYAFLSYVCHVPPYLAMPYL